MKSMLTAAALISATTLIAACQSGPYTPPEPKTEVPTTKMSVGNFISPKACTSGTNTLNGKLIGASLCIRSQKYEVFGGPDITLSFNRELVTVLTPEEAVKGFRATKYGVTASFKCEEIPKKDTDEGRSYHCSYDASNLPLIRADITFP
ncbi:hypothetical protein C4J93_2853 [Pseudomonas sp. R2-37-08W]|uniref:LptM family lipoprotein n=1 Tax=unclassified Pseudomonas TaxID=196821 RepID=UPI000F58CF57|nr:MULTISPECIES: hypothetical protein [unclassified Pseudomonas]AZF11050.1 hypothetical protein C4J93_2853 [Pseudomonas sp. R2-37-08W]AZF42793.1 hypothetical protein C4J87_2635 [Pseudomonas sp. R1-43-08]AZF48012.1 hypothetical protein C4J86_2778 [Pseudomonas sp. R2-7-07]AZF53391.1 hypothetical protein C4J85_2907 [Pseudomonas sp. R4-34-07]AZF58520.1 hypothetical protein C4J84_2644 [Pseudomonas sp. R11-23-07]